MAPGIVPTEDLEAILADAPWQALAGERLFITGGTGFFGSWLLQSMCAARLRYGLDLSATVLTRDPIAAAAGLALAPGHDFIQWHQGDLRTFTDPPGAFTHLLHIATPASTGFSETSSVDMLDILVEGTRRVLELARRAGVKRALLTSSGAVYGVQPPEMEQFEEDYLGCPDCLNPGTTYGEGKRLAEQLFALYAERHGLEAVVARCFAFLGPHLPLGGHFAAGNFIADALEGRPIQVRGDGRPLRSYMYPTDLVTWLVTMLVHGASGRAYNVGSDQALPLGDLARRVGSLSGVPVEILGAPDAGPAPRYVPSTERARTELGLALKVCLEEALVRTLNWHRGNRTRE